MTDIESAITGKTVEDNYNELHSNGDVSIPLPKGEVLNQQVEDHYKQHGKNEQKVNWLRQEGTQAFIKQLEGVRQDKLSEAENLAKNGLNDQAIRKLLQAASIKETITIIREP